jgi:predicted peptidase
LIVPILNKYLSVSLPHFFCGAALLMGMKIQLQNWLIQTSKINFVGVIKISSTPTIFFHNSDDIVNPVTQRDLLENALTENSALHQFVKAQNQRHRFRLDFLHFFS